MESAPQDLTAFYTREYPKLVGALDLYCGDLQVAEEMAQEALLRTCRDWHKVRAMASPGGWTHRVAMNLANSHYRRQRIARRVHERLRHGAEAVVAAPEPETAASVRAAILRLPQPQRTAVVLHYYLDHSLAEIAELTRTPLGTVKSHLHRARRALHHHLSLDDDLEVPDAHRA